MSEQCPDILRCDPQNLRQAMSIHTRKITDACRDKDCVEDLRVYLTAGSQQTLDNAVNVRVTMPMSSLINICREKVTILPKVSSFFCATFLSERRASLNSPVCLISSSSLIACS